jgi:hypothetical protein
MRREGERERDMYELWVNEREREGEERGRGEREREPYPMAAGALSVLTC